MNPLLPFLFSVKRMVLIAIGCVFVVVIVQLETALHTARQDLATLQTTFQTTSEEISSYQTKIGELAKRQAEVEFNIENPSSPGLMDVDTALQIAVDAVESPPAVQPYLLEDAKYISDYHQLNPDFPTGPGFQFTLQVQEGHFIVAVSAVTGAVNFVNEFR